MLGLDKDMTVEETRSLGILDKDGVHLNPLDAGQLFFEFFNENS